MSASEVCRRYNPRHAALGQIRSSPEAPGASGAGPSLPTQPERKLSAVSFKRPAPFHLPKLSSLFLPTTNSLVYGLSLTTATASPHKLYTIGSYYEDIRLRERNARGSGTTL